MKYCSVCGNDQLAFRIPEGDHLPRFICDNCNTIHYTNPRMVVGCIIEHNNAVMLARRGIEPRFGFWNLPCGFLENSETVEDGAIREVLEETGAKVEIEHLHTVYSLPHAHQVYLIFKARLLGEHYHTTPESTDIEFFKFSDIPWHDMAFSSNSFAIKKLIDDKKHGKAGQIHLGHYTK